MCVRESGRCMHMCVCMCLPRDSLEAQSPDPTVSTLTGLRKVTAMLGFYTRLPSLHAHTAGALIPELLLSFPSTCFLSFSHLPKLKQDLQERGTLPSPTHTHTHCTRALARCPSSQPVCFALFVYD